MRNNKLFSNFGNAIIIDDKRDEVDGLMDFLMGCGIPCLYINPNSMYQESIGDAIVGSRIVFLDLVYGQSSLGSDYLTHAVNILRMLAEKGLKNYVLFIWSMHSNQIEDLKNMLAEKMGVDQPIGVYDIDKVSAIGPEPYSISTFAKETLKGKLKEIQSENSLVFDLLRWECSARRAVCQTFNEIVSVSFDTGAGEPGVERVLGALAHNDIDQENLKTALYGMCALVSDNIRRDLDGEAYKSSIPAVGDGKKASDEDFDLSMRMNRRKAFYVGDSNKNSLGNMYKIYKKNSKRCRLYKIIDKMKIEKRKWHPVLVDMTPECSFANSDDRIFIRGVKIFDLSSRKELEDIRNGFKKEKYNFLAYRDDDAFCCVILDFMDVCSMAKNDTKKLKIIGHFKDSYRLYIRQKFSHYIGRVGTNVYEKIV